MSLKPLDPPVTLPESGNGVRARRRRARRRRVVFPVVSLALAVAIPLLAWAGFHTLVRSEEGDTVGRRRPTVGDLTLVAGAVIPPTPAALVVHRGPEGAVEGLTILSLWPGGGGGVVFVPVATVPGVGPEAPVGAVAQSVERLLALRLDTTDQLDDAAWARVTGPVGRLLVDNPDPLVGFETGSIDLEPGRVGEFLRSRRPGESDLARLVRHQALWEGWLSRVRTDKAAAPADDDSGLTRFVRGLASGSVVYRTLPVEAEQAQGREDLAADPVAVRVLVAQLMPGALTPASDRPGVRLLSASARDVLLPAARRLSGSGAEIVLVGRAEQRGSVTEVAFHERTGRTVARRIQRALGVGDVRLRRQDVEAFDLTVVIGDDFTGDQEGGSTG